MKVAITGATGFLGRHLVREVAAAGHTPVAVCRTPSKAADLGVEVRKADLRDLHALTAAFQGCEGMVANAALVPGSVVKPDETEFIADNVLGAVHHLEAAASAGVKRIVWISTIAVYRTRLFVPQAEDSPRIQPQHPTWDWNNLTTHPMYARSKSMAEMEIWPRAQQHGFDLTVLRPGPVYGPGDGKLTLDYARQLCRPLVTAVTVEAPHVHGADVGMAAASAFDRPASIGQAYNLGGTRTSPYRFLSAWRNALGWRKPVIPVPLPLAVRLDDSRAQQDLNFRPRSIQSAMPELCRRFFPDGRTVSW